MSKRVYHRLTDEEYARILAWYKQSLVDRRESRKHRKVDKQIVMAQKMGMSLARLEQVIVHRVRPELGFI